MIYDGKSAYKWLKRRLKQERWCYKSRNQNKDSQGLSLIRQHIYEQALSKFKKVHKNEKI